MRDNTETNTCFGHLNSLKNKALKYLNVKAPMQNKKYYSAISGIVCMTE